MIMLSMMNEDKQTRVTHLVCRALYSTGKFRVTEDIWFLQRGIITTFHVSG